MGFFAVFYRKILRSFFQNIFILRLSELRGLIIPPLLDKRGIIIQRPLKNQAVYSIIDYITHSTIREHIYYSPPIQ